MESLEKGSFLVRFKTFAFVKRISMILSFGKAAVFDYKFSERCPAARTEKVSVCSESQFADLSIIDTECRENDFTISRPTHSSSANCRCHPHLTTMHQNPVNAWHSRIPTTPSDSGIQMLVVAHQSGCMA